MPSSEARHGFVASLARQKLAVAGLVLLGVFYVAFLMGMKRGSVGIVQRVYRMRAQHLAKHRDVAGHAADEQRVVALRVLEVDVGAGVDEHARDSDMVAQRGRCHGSAPVAIARVDGHAVGEQATHVSDVTASRCGHQNARAPILRAPRVRAADATATRG